MAMILATTPRERSIARIRRSNWVATGGDCNDGDDAIHPGADDAPDLAFLDSNCDLIDGDLENSIFVDSVNGNDGNNGLTPDAPVFNVSRGYERAATYQRDWILISAGSSVVVDDFFEGKNLAGGYDALSGWSRSSGNNQVMTVPNTGALIDGWSIPTTWQLVSVDALSSPDGPSIGMRILNSSNLLLEQVTVLADIAGNGVNGRSGAPLGSSGDGNTGAKGDNGVEDDPSIVCGHGTDPLGGNGGAAKTCGGFAGGNGGLPGLGSDIGLAGSNGDPAPLGGAGGSGGLRGQTGGNGTAGDPGSTGADGAGGQSFGALDASGIYIPSHGGNGTLGSGGYGGGGGGGGGGGTNSCDSWGGGGGGGGSGGCRGNPGERGTGGMASIGIVLVDSSVEILNSSISSNWGGFGGNGGSGAAGGFGGKGGLGGAGQDDSGPGGPGGAGGAGGRGGHGGGGGGGPSIGIVCVGSSTLTNNGSTVTPGLARPGGVSAGNNGEIGELAATKDC